MLGKNAGKDMEGRLRELLGQRVTVQFRADERTDGSGDMYFYSVATGKLASGHYPKLYRLVCKGGASMTFDWRWINGMIANPVGNDLPLITIFTGRPPKGEQHG